MTFSNRLTYQAITLSTALLATQSFATQFFEFNIDNPPGNPNGGEILNIYTTYHPSDETFTWRSTSAQANSSFTDSFWLVISDGPNPKAMVQEYAIMYGDLATGILTTYVYDGENNSDSWMDPTGFISSSGPNFISVNDMGNERTYEFSLDTSFINSFMNTPDWDGVEFSSNVGIWYHNAIGSNFTYNMDGTISSYTVENSGWYDTADQQAVYVISPASIALLSFGLCLFPLLKRRKLSLGFF